MNLAFGAFYVFMTLFCWHTACQAWRWFKCNILHEVQKCICLSVYRLHNTLWDFVLFLGVLCWLWQLWIYGCIQTVRLTSITVKISTPGMLSCKQLQLSFLKN